MRYSIQNATVDMVTSVGGSGIKIAPNTGIIFATLSEQQASVLQEKGCILHPIGKVNTMDVRVPVSVVTPTPVQGYPLYTPAQLAGLVDVDVFRAVTSPPLYGSGVNVAVIDTGILESHEDIEGRVVYSKNFTTDAMRDEFDHGTGVAAIIVAVAPMCNILNLKVLDDEGVGTEEEVILAIDHCVSLIGTEYAPATINVSIGSQDDGDPYNPMRVAVRAALARGMWFSCAAGNGGPDPITITSPATELNARAVGSVGVEFSVSGFSSRGPTREGLIKPDIMMFGENIITASSKSNTAKVAKSGTSFSAPFISGFNALYVEAVARHVAVDSQLSAAFPTITDIMSQLLTPEAMTHYLPLICAKPAGQVAGKDNTYGFGVPLGSLMADSFRPSGDVDLSSVIGLMVPVMMIGMAMKTMTTTTTAAKRRL